MISRLPLLVLSLAAPLSAQAVFPYGTATPGLGGSSPRAWVASDPRIGNADFRITVDRATGGASALLALGSDQTRVLVAGFELLVDPAAAAFLLVPHTLSGIPGTVGAGEGEIVVPIPNLPQLVGLSLFGQWWILDGAAPGGIAASDGVDIAIRDAQLLVGTVGTGIEAITPGGQSSIQPFQARSFGVDLVLSRDGTAATVLVSDSAVGSQIQHFDLSTSPPVHLGTGSEASRIHLHRSGLAYVLSFDFTGASSICTLVVDPSDPQFGSTTTVLSFPLLFGPGDLALSPDGRRMVYRSIGSALAVIDLEPGPGQYQTLNTVQQPPGLTAIFLELVPDASSVFAVDVFNEWVAQIDLTTGQVLYQLQRTDIEHSAIDPRGRTLVLAEPTQNSITVVDLEAGPGAYVVTQFAADAPGEMTFTGDGAAILVATANGYELFDLSGTKIGGAATGAPRGPFGVAWR